MTIDWWTLGLQAVNVAILVWLLGRVFWRPVAAVIAERRAQTTRMLAEAAAKRTAADEALAAIERTRAGLAQERDAILDAARTTAARERAARLAETEQAAAALAETARAVAAREKGAIDEAWMAQASRLSVEIAGRLLARLDGTVAQDAFLGWLVAEIRGLPPAARRAIALNGAADAAVPASDGAPLEMVSATPLAPAEQARCRARIADALDSQSLGIDLRLTFRTDPDLIAGLELRGPHVAVRNSWRADLDRILKDLTHDHAT